MFKAYAPNVHIGTAALPQKKKTENRALNKQEIATLINGIDGHKIEAPILLALWLGLRRSEALALKWSDINFDKQTLRVNEAIVLSMGNEMVTKGTKTTDSTRILKIPAYILHKLTTLPRESEYVFNGRGDDLTKGFPKLCAELGLDRFKFHDLRRSMATVGLSLNIADKVMMTRGGWSSPQTMKMPIR